jgi:hypothetical protein
MCGTPYPIIRNNWYTDFVHGCHAQTKGMIGLLISLMRRIPYRKTWYDHITKHKIWSIFFLWLNPIHIYPNRRYDLCFLRDPAFCCEDFFTTTWTASTTYSRRAANQYFQLFQPFQTISIFSFVWFIIIQTHHHVLWMVRHYSNTPPRSTRAHLVGASHLRAETVGSPKIKRWAVGSISLGCQHIYLTSLLIKLNHCQVSFLHTISNFGLGGWGV